MVAHMPGALASFLLHRARNKPYVIDPETHAFQQDLEYLTSTSERGGIKRSVRVLAAAYGPPVSTKLEKEEPVLPSDFESPDIVAGFTKRVLEFQHDRIRKEANESDAAKYYRFKKTDKTPASFGPSLLVAPYFHLTAMTYEKWLPVNLALAAAAAPIAKSYRCPLAIQVVLGLDLLVDPYMRKKVAQSYSEVECDTILLWIDRFQEDRASSGALAALVDLIRSLGSKKPIVNLYGGYFSVLLSRTQLAPPLVAVTHGLEYGEARSVIPVGGGVPVSKFYLPGVHARLVFREAYRAVLALGGLESPEQFFEKVCDCPECRVVIVGDPNASFRDYGNTKTLPPTSKRRRAMEFPTQETKNHCVRHYMFVKEREYRGAQTLAETIAALDAAYASLNRVLSPEAIAHCGVWTERLKALNEGK
jgi:hypothetical protein